MSLHPKHHTKYLIHLEGLANPCGALLSVALLLRHSLGWSAEAAAVERAVAEALAAGARTADLVAPGGRALSTAQAGDAVISRLRRAP